MDRCEVHNQHFILYCATCKELLCVQCIDRHGPFGHVLLSTQRAIQSFRSQLLDAQNELAHQKSAIRHAVRESESERGKNVEDAAATSVEEMLTVFEQDIEIVMKPHRKAGEAGRITFKPVAA